MFEEIPGDRHGFRPLRPRPVFIGPFMVGSGALLAMLGGSAAAATMLTASALGAFDFEHKPTKPPAPLVTSPPAAGPTRSQTSVGTSARPPKSSSTAKSRPTVTLVPKPAGKPAQKATAGPASPTAMASPSDTVTVVLGPPLAVTPTAASGSAAPTAEPSESQPTPDVSTTPTPSPPPDPTASPSESAPSGGNALVAPSTPGAAPAAPTSAPPAQ